MPAARITANIHLMSAEDERIRLGVVVRSLGPFPFDGIVCEKDVPPPDDWIDEQVDADVLRRLGDKNGISWWGVLPFSGGMALCPEPLLSFLRPASYDDFLRAADTANPPARHRLVKLFPEFVNRLLEERKRNLT